MRDYAQSNRTALRILSTSDLHMHVATSLVAGVGDQQRGGLARVATLIGQRSAAAPGHSLILDNGDFLQGSKISDHLARQVKDGKQHPLAAAFNRIGYDVVGLGNHDFDYGLPVLSEVARQLKAPVVSANFDPYEPTPWIQPSVLLNAGPLSIGVTSGIPAGTELWSHTQLLGKARVRDLLTSLQMETDRLRDQGADIVVVLAHSGFARAETDPDNILAQIIDSEIADLVVGGHTHTVFPEPDTPSQSDQTAIIPGYGGQWLGEFDLTLSQNAKRRWQVDSLETRLIPVDVSIPEDPRILHLFEPSTREATRSLARPIGHTPVPMTTYFATIAPNAALTFIANVQTAAMEEMRAGTEYADLPILSAVSPAKSGGIYGPTHFTDIPAGDLTVGHLRDLQEFSNNLWGAVITGAEVKMWLERAASFFNQQRVDQDSYLTNDNVPPFNFDVLYGVTYQIDPREPARYAVDGSELNPGAQRVSDIRYQGHRLDPEQTFLIAASSFRICGGGAFPGMCPERACLKSDRNIRNFMEEHSDVARSNTAEPVWRFAQSGPPVRTWIRTGPGALNHLNDIAHMSPGAPRPGSGGHIDIPLTL